MKNALRHLFGVLLLLATALFATQCRNDDTALRRKKQPANEQANPLKGGPTQSNPAKAPAYVLETLNYVKAHNEAPDGYVGGRTFENREKRLPKQAPDGSKIRYREWDVYPKERGKNRGPERLVTGSDRSAWYTSDHYKRFTRIE